MTRRTKRQRSDAARRGWATRRENVERERRSVAAKRGWITRRLNREGTAQLAVYDIRRVERNAELGYAKSLADAALIGETAAADDEEVDEVFRGKGPRRRDGTRHPAYLVSYRKIKLEDVEDMSDEWEIGFEYRGADRSGHVDVNIRIARNDGRPFGLTEAARVLKNFQANLSLDDANPIPPGYRMAFIDWRRPRWGTDWQSGDEADIVSFHAPMYVESNNPMVWSILPTGNTRLGSVK